MFGTDVPFIRGIELQVTGWLITWLALGKAALHPLLRDPLIRGRGQMYQTWKHKGRGLPDSHRGHSTQANKVFLGQS